METTEIGVGKAPFKLGLNTREGAWAWLQGSFDPEHVALNSEGIVKALGTLLPGSVIHIVTPPGLAPELRGRSIGPADAVKFYSRPYVTIDTETGTVVEDNEDIMTKRELTLVSWFIRGEAFFNDEPGKFPQDMVQYVWTPAKHVYVYEIKRWDTGIELVGAAYTRDKKRQATFTIDGDVYDRFCRLADELAINRSRFVENKMREFMVKNAAG